MRLLAIIAALALLATAASAAPTVSVLPASLTVSTGDTFFLSIEVNADAGAISCFSVTIDFDPTMLRLDGSAEGLLYGSSPEDTFFQHEVNAQDKDVFSACVLGFGTTVTPPGQLFTVEFYALNDGTTSVDVLLAELRDVDRALIPGVQSSNSSVSINLTPTPPAAPYGAVKLLATPNPASGSVLFQLEGDDARKAGTETLQQGQVQLFDVAGRRVATSSMRPVGDGLRWDLRDRRGQSLAAGMYFAVVRDGGRILARTKLLVVD